VKRRALLATAGSTTAAPASAGCTRFTRSEASTKLVLENDYRKRVTLEVRVEGPSGTPFDRAVSLDPDESRTFEPFELDDQYFVYVSTPGDDVTVGELSEFGLKACGDYPTRLWVEKYGELQGAIAGCGA